MNNFDIKIMNIFGYSYDVDSIQYEADIRINSEGSFDYTLSRSEQEPEELHYRTKSKEFNYTFYDLISEFNYSKTSDLQSKTELDHGYIIEIIDDEGNTEKYEYKGLMEDNDQIELAEIILLFFPAYEDVPPFLGRPLYEEEIYDDED